ncbi:MAG: L-threonylcarbamoyladenylate synthase [Planctomycetota bacterium]
MSPGTPRRRVDRSGVDAAGTAAALDEAAALLRAGGLVAFPTETVYGLGADATDAEAVAAIYRAKGRPATNPLIAHASGIAMARTLASTWTDDAEALARRFWPGPLTIVVTRSDLVPDVVSAGLETVGVRVPDALVARALIERVGRPLAAPSANRSTEISPTTADHVLKGLDGRIALVLDAGPTTVGLESTVVDVTGAAPVVLRPGPIGAEEVAAALGRPVRVAAGPAESAAVSPSAGPAARSPGQMEVHYAPRTPATRAEPGEPLPAHGPQARLAVLAIGPARADAPAASLVVALEEIEAATRELYGALHRLDDADVDEILVLMPPDTPGWTAVRDRLRRATTAPPQTDP